MKYLLALCAFLAACDDGASPEMVDGDGTLGVPVADLEQWGLTECPVGLEQVDGLCVAGSVDMQLDIDDCKAVAKCLPGKYSCARASVVGLLDRQAGMQRPSLEWTREDGVMAERLTYSTWSAEYAITNFGIEDAKGLELIAGQVERRDDDGSAECLIGIEGDVVQDHWKWSKVREAVR